jgi:hypothetical protein
MKKQILVITCALLVAASFSSCFIRHHHHDTSVSISDSGDEYEMCASFDENKTRKIQRLLDRELNIDIGRSGRTAHVDANITLDDHTTFYMRALPGQLRINFDKRANTEDSWEKIQDVCEEIKDALEDK